MDVKVEASILGAISKVISDIPGDKSISHRAVIIGALAKNSSEFTNVLFSEDCLNTLAHFQKMGVNIQVNQSHKSIKISGVGRHGLKKPDSVLDCGNSGTSIRLMTGVMCAQPFASVLTGDSSIQTRPMKRIIMPLSLMGAKIEGEKKLGTQDIVPPLTIVPVNKIDAIHYTLPVASAQVKSAILLASLYSNNATTIIQPETTRDHTERMLAHYGADIQTDGYTIICSGKNELVNPDQATIRIPSDISSAAFFMVLASILPKSQLKLRGIGLNPTRDRIIDVLRQMGVQIKIENKIEGVEPICDLVVSTSEIKNREIKKSDIPFIIDEIPILAIAAVFGKGKFVVTGAKELRAKESDRIAAIGAMVVAMGAKFEEKEDGFILTPPEKILNFEVDSHGDHRIAMSAIIGAVGAHVEANIFGCACINTSFPNFFDILESLGVKLSQ